MSTTGCHSNNSSLFHINSSSSSFLPSYQQFARGKWLIRPEFHLPCMLLSLSIIILYCLELRVVLYYKKNPPFTSTYFRIWVMQAVADLLSLLCYIGFSFTRNLPRTWGFWLELNSTPFPRVIVILNGAVVLCQMTGVAMTSCNRYLKLCKPTAQLTARLDATSSIQFFFIILIFPLLISTLILHRTAPIFVYTGGYSSVIAPCLQKPGKLIYSVVAPICCILTLFTSTLCYVKIVQKITKMSYLKRRALKTERTLTLLSAPVFISLWLVFLYYCMIVIAILLSWVPAYDLLFAYYHLLNLTLSVTNPLSALFSRDIRGRILFQQVEFSAARQTFLS